VVSLVVRPPGSVIKPGTEEYGLSAPEILGHRAACGGRPAGCSRASL